MSDEQILWCLIGAGVLLIIIVLIIIFKKKKSSRQEEEFPELLEALGGSDNISNVVLNGSRVSLEFDNKRIVDKEHIKESGVETIVVSNKKITLVIGKKAPLIYKYLNNNLKA